MMKKIIGFLSVILGVTQPFFGTGSVDVFKKYNKNKCFIETGSLYGQGIEDALKAGFQHVISIEISEKYFQLCQEKFKKNPAVHVVFGDSSLLLSSVLSSIDAPITFWLDGHFSNGDTGKGKSNTPLLEELSAIRNHHIKNHTILIDDVRLLGVEDLDYITLDQIKNLVLSINPNYQFKFENGYVKNDILVAYVEK